MILALEGPNGVGKDTIAMKVADRLNASFMHYPYKDCITGQKIYEMLEGPKENFDPIVFQSLHLANCYEMLNKMRRLEDNGLVILSRYNLSAEVFGIIDGCSHDFIKSLYQDLPIPWYIIITAPKPYRDQAGQDNHENMETWHRSNRMYRLIAEERGYPVIMNMDLDKSVQQCILLIRNHCSRWPMLE